LADLVCVRLVVAAAAALGERAPARIPAMAAEPALRAGSS
jgi:hypothetical protein